MARGKYRGARSEGDYYLSDRDLTGAYLDEMRVGGSARPLGRAAPDEDVQPHEGDDAGDAAPAASRGSGTFRQRLATAIAPKPPAARTPRAPRAPTGASGARSTSPARSRSRSQVVVPEGKTLQDLINNLDRNERVISLAAAVLGVAAAIVIAVYFAHPKPHVKNEVDGPLVGAIIGVPSLLLGGSVFIGRRALVGFLALLTGFAVLTLTGPYGLIYFGIGLWLIMKAQRYSRAAREQSGGARPTREPRRKASTPGRDASPPAKRGATGKSTGKGRPATAGPKPPAASKRYTPPRGAARSGRGASR